MKGVFKKVIQTIYLKWLNLLGFLIATLGAVLLGYGSDVIVDVNTSLVEYVAQHTGTADYSGVPGEVFEKFYNQLRLGKRLNFLGYGFFIIGFLIQLMDSWKQREKMPNG
jgi:hypothetical protein